MLQFSNVTKKFQIDFWSSPFIALNQLSFRLQGGSLTGFLGANGSGKTTAIKILLGLIFPSSGTIHFHEWKDLTAEERLKKIGHTPERPYYYPYLSGLEFLTYVGSLSGVPRTKLASRIEEYATRLSMSAHLEKKISGYSKGMLQRLGLIGALIHDPELLILDEPTAGIDPLGRKEIKNFLHSLYEKGKTILVSSHIVSDLEEICSHLIIIDKGALVYEGTCHELIENNAKSEYFALIEGESQELKTLSQKVKRIGKDTYEHLFDTGKKEEFLKTCVHLKKIPIKFERRMPTLEEIVYNFS